MDKAYSKAAAEAQGGEGSRSPAKQVAQLKKENKQLQQELKSLGKQGDEPNPTQENLQPDLADLVEKAKDLEK
eukprot:7961648-Prorocentrum_lima.AAC.1